MAKTVVKQSPWYQSVLYVLGAAIISSLAARIITKVLLEQDIRNPSTIAGNSIGAGVFMAFLFIFLEFFLTYIFAVVILHHGRVRRGMLIPLFAVATASSAIIGFGSALTLFHVACIYSMAFIGFYVLFTINPIVIPLVIGAAATVGAWGFFPEYGNRMSLRTYQEKMTAEKEVVRIPLYIPKEPIDGYKLESFDHNPELKPETVGLNFSGGLGANTYRMSDFEKKPIDTCGIATTSPNGIVIYSCRPIGTEAVTGYYATVGNATIFLNHLPSEFTQENAEHLFDAMKLSTLDELKAITSSH